MIISSFIVILTQWNKYWKYNTMLGLCFNEESFFFVENTCAYLFHLLIYYILEQEISIGAWKKHLSIHLLLASAWLLVIHVGLIYLVDEFFLLLV